MSYKSDKFPTSLLSIFVLRRSWFIVNKNNIKNLQKCVILYKYVLYIYI